MAKPISKSYPCAHCGAIVVRAESNAGKIYIASVQHVSSQYADPYSSRQKVIYPAHHCDPLEVDRYQKRIALAIENGQIVKGQKIEVIKGRKVAKGTSGIVFWIGYQMMNGSEIVDRVGFKSEDGTTYFINANNIQAITEGSISERR